MDHMSTMCPLVIFANKNFVFVSFLETPSVQQLVVLYDTVIGCY